MNAEDAEALEAWAENVNFNTLIDRLHAAGVPTELVDQLEDMFSALTSQAVEVEAEASVAA